MDTRITNCIWGHGCIQKGLHIEVSTGRVGGLYNRSSGTPLYDQLRPFFVYMSNESTDSTVLTTPTYDRDEKSKNLAMIECIIFVYY